MTLIIRKQGSQVWRSTSLEIHSSSSQCSFEGVRSSVEANGVVLQAPKPNWNLPKCKGGSGCWQATAGFQSNSWFHLTWSSTGLEIYWLWCVYSVIAGICKIVTMGRTSSRTRKSTERTTTKQQQQRRRCFGKWQLPSKLSLCMFLSSWPMTLIIRKQGSQVWRSTISAWSQCSFEGVRSSVEGNGVVLQAPKRNWKLPKANAKGMQRGMYLFIWFKVHSFKADRSRGTWNHTAK